MSQKDVLADLERRAELGGGEDRLRRQREASKLTASSSKRTPYWW